MVGKGLPARYLVPGTSGIHDIICLGYVGCVRLGVGADAVRAGAQERKAHIEAGWKEQQEARAANTEQRVVSEEARREVELKWKAAQESWKARAQFA